MERRVTRLRGPIPRPRLTWFLSKQTRLRSLVSTPRQILTVAPSLIGEYFLRRHLASGKSPPNGSTVSVPMFVVPVVSPRPSALVIGTIKIKHLSRLAVAMSAPQMRLIGRFNCLVTRIFDTPLFLLLHLNVLQPTPVRLKRCTIPSPPTTSLISNLQSHNNLTLLGESNSVLVGDVEVPDGVPSSLSSGDVP